MRGILRATAAVLVWIALAMPDRVNGQTSMGILPVSVTAVNESLMDARQWQAFSNKMQDYFIAGITGNLSVNKLTQEHILLLLKEVPAPDLENLEAEAYQIISKKEKLQYLLKFSVETLQVSGLHVITQARITIIDGNNGKVFWDKPVKSSRNVSNAVMNDQLLADEVYKPLIDNIFKEIKALNY